MSELEEIKKELSNTELSKLDQRIIYLRIKGYTYGDIQTITGNPSKKYIRKVLMNYDPSLIDKECGKTERTWKWWK